MRTRDARVPGADSWVRVLFAVIAAIYILQLFVPDPFLGAARFDESFYHLPTVRLFQQRGLVEAAKNYPSATTPLYHIIMAAVYGRIPDLWLRVAWVAVTLASGWLLYQHLLHDPRTAGSLAPIAVTIAFLASPTVRAAAAYFVTDGLSLQLTIASLFLLRKSNAESPSPSRVSAGAALVTAYASFYARQYYLWVPMYVTHRLLSGCNRTGRAVVAAASAALLLPAVALFLTWGRATPPRVWEAHTGTDILISVPTTLSFIGIFVLPAFALALRDLFSDWVYNRPAWARRAVLGGIGGLVVYVGLLLGAGFQIQEYVARILGALKGLGSRGYDPVSRAFILRPRGAGSLVRDRWSATVVVDRVHASFHGEWVSVLTLLRPGSYAVSLPRGDTARRRTDRAWPVGVVLSRFQRKLFRRSPPLDAVVNLRGLLAVRRVPPPPESTPIAFRIRSPRIVRFG